MKITLKELAVICSVSISTLSKALNDSYDISKSTKQRIRILRECSFKYHKICINIVGLDDRLRNLFFNLIQIESCY